LRKKEREEIKQLLPVWQDRVLDYLLYLKMVIYESGHHLNPDELRKGASAFFEEQTWGKLNEITRRDLAECVQCLLYNLPTPAGMLALRATESVLREYYVEKTNNQIQNPSWGRIIHDLNENKVQDNLIHQLKYLGIELRNKLAHPDAVLEQKKAERIFSIIVEAISEMKKGKG